MEKTKCTKCYCECDFCVSFKERLKSFCKECFLFSCCCSCKAS